jgi:hypothetical protein
MVLAGGRLLLAGPPDLADENRMLGYLPGAEDDINRQLHAQNEAWQGKRGGRLWVVASEDGRKVAEYGLDGVPVFDGMAVGGGRVLLSLTSGQVVCLVEK